MPRQRPTPVPRASAALEPLVVIDRLEVHRLRVEGRRLMASYSVTSGGTTDTQNLIYRWEDRVFDDSPASRNLAAMIAVQVALNYGLFCREIVFAVPLDGHDRAFIEEFVENTSREIFVHKFLMPNPFLHGPAARLEPVKLERYTAARLLFTEQAGRGEPWSVSRARHAILSSGGKDSLLTLGLLDELGLETHPIFVNESGRHWYTALNAYRQLVTSHAGTARVWTNSDRLFAWMLRRLPFVRQDFARVRSDEYPIRLWTVAVFLFGALPLVRQRGVGRVLVGNEFDTTVPANHRGIPHYSALYDQSRFFDNAMSRYFRRKGWNVSQFSVLRPLSEFLIQRVLTRRYPELQQHQISCHAAHLEAGRVRPCGDCEKCRRIVGMLSALGADPGRCGYTPGQVRHALASLEVETIHQEQPAAQHLAWQLVEAGLIKVPTNPSFQPEPHPEVLSLRFDRVHAPGDSIPTDLRRPLWSLLLAETDGAVTRVDRAWQAFDPLGEKFLAEPYAFEAPAAMKEAAASPAEVRTPPHIVGELTWPAARERFKQVDVALLPVGAIEQHGPHLPLDTDTFDADYLARRVAAACSEPKPFVLPPIAYGVSYHNDDFAGTLSVNPETLIRFVYEVGMSAAKNGVTKLVMINGHGGNAPALHVAAQMINRDAHIFTCVDTGETSDAEVHELIETPNDVHAGEIETSTSLAVRPELVYMDLAPDSTPRFGSSFLDFSGRGSVTWFGRTIKISDTGVLGDATRADRVKGERIWEIMTRRLVELVEDLKRLSLDELHRRRP